MTEINRVPCFVTFQNMKNSRTELQSLKKKFPIVRQVVFSVVLLFVSNCKDKHNFKKDILITENPLYTYNFFPINKFRTL